MADPLYARARDTAARLIRKYGGPAVLQMRSSSSGGPLERRGNPSVHIPVRAVLIRAPVLGASREAAQAGILLSSTRDVAFMSLEGLPRDPQGDLMYPQKDDKILIGFGMEATYSGETLSRARLILEPIPLAPAGPDSLVYWRLELA